MCNFDVSLHTDLNKKEMIAARDQFVKKLRTDDCVLIYFSGHGVEYQGEQFLIPCQMKDPERIDAIKFTAFSCDAVIIELAENARTGLKMIVTDSCRTEYRGVMKSISKRTGISYEGINTYFDPNKAQTENIKKGGSVDYTETKNLIRMAAAASGQEADAGRGDNLSLYTKSLLSNMQSSDLSIMDVFIKVGKELEDRDAKPVISFTAPGTIVQEFRFFKDELNNA